MWDELYELQQRAHITRGLLRDGVVVEGVWHAKAVEPEI
jgi:hypothetical protein